IDERGGEDRAGSLPDEGQQFLGRVEGVAGDGDLADVVTTAFDDGDGDDEFVVVGIVESDGGRIDFDVEIAEITVVVAQLVEVGLEVVVPETAAGGQPGKPAPFLRGHLLAQLAGGDVLVAGELDFVDVDLVALGDIESDGAKTGGGV